MAQRPRREMIEHKSDREKIIAAFMALLAERAFEDIGFRDISTRAGVALDACRAEFGSTLAVLAAHMKEIDRKVLAGGTAADAAEEGPRDRLFDVLMRRLETLAPHKAAVRSLMRSASRHPGLALALNGLAVRSLQWMLTAADIDAAGSRGAVRAQGLAMLFGRVLCTWVDDDDPGLARTMASLDRELARGARWSVMLDDLCSLVPTRCCRRASWRSRHDRSGDETVTA